MTDPFDDLEADLFSEHSDLADAATYTPDGGDAVSLHVVVDHDVEIQPDGFEGGFPSRATTIEGALSDFGQEPGRGDTIVIGSTTYTVESPIANDGRFCTVIVKAS